MYNTIAKENEEFIRSVGEIMFVPSVKWRILPSTTYVSYKILLIHDDGENPETLGRFSLRHIGSQEYNMSDIKISDIRGGGLKELMLRMVVEKAMEIAGDNESQFLVMETEDISLIGTFLEHNFKVIKQTYENYTMYRGIKTRQEFNKTGGDE